MLLGGFQKTSFIDYPGKISCVIFLTGCNFKCPYCHNPGLATGDQTSPSFLTQNWIYDFLERRKGLLEGVVITGGEPTLQKDLAPFCKKIKSLGYPIKLDTNGSKPRVIKELIDQGIFDYIAMDIKTDPGRYFPAITHKNSRDSILSSIRTIMESGMDYEFRTTCVKPFIDENVIKTISTLIKGASLYVLQRFKKSEILNPEFFEEDSLLYNDDDLEGFKAIASPMVQKCIVR
jgi:pyruvate formate lyase activating enzyme